MAKQKVRKVLVCGAGGFIGSHLVKRLKKEGHWVRGVDIKYPEFSKTQADEFLILDLREKKNTDKALKLDKGTFDDVYQLAADMGGMGFISSAECEIMRNNALINLNMVHSAATSAVKRYFFSSSVCVYRDMKIGEPELTEQQAYPALPDNEYGWEKLYAERLATAYGKKYGFKVRIARFQNCYGPEGTWQGGREKAPAALCRKVAKAKNGEPVEIWGNGTAVRSYIYIDDLVEGIRHLVESNLDEPVNIGSPKYFSVKELVGAIGEISGKKIRITCVKGPVGVQSRNFSNKKIYSTGWRAKFSLKDGLKQTYFWIEKQANKK